MPTARSPSRFSLLLLALLALGSPVRAAKPEPTLQEQFDEGIRAMNRSNYTKALEVLNRIRIYHQDHPLSVRASLAIADVYFKKGDFDQARLEYEDFISLHPQGLPGDECKPYRCLDYVYFRIGSTLVKKAPKAAGRDQTWTVQARDTWRNFVQLYPESEHVPEVQEFLAEAEERLAKKELLIARFYARREAWPAVQGRAYGLASQYAATSHLPEAITLLDQALDAQAPENRQAVISGLELRARQLEMSADPETKAGAEALRRELERLR